MIDIALAKNAALRARRGLLWLQDGGAHESHRSDQDQPPRRSHEP